MDIREDPAGIGAAIDPGCVSACAPRGPDGHQPTLRPDRGIKVNRISKVAGGKNLSKEGADKGPSYRDKLSG